MRHLSLTLSLVCLAVSGFAQQTNIKTVDLGLPSHTLWADRNVGATSPEDYGKGFDWDQHMEYEKSTGKCMISKYALQNCSESKHASSVCDNKVELDEEDDYAQKYAGENWRTPSLTQLQELTLFCKREYVKINGQYCFKFTGPNGNYILLPKDKTEESNVCYCWSRNLFEKNDANACLMKCAYYKDKGRLIDYAKMMYSPRVNAGSFCPFVRPVYYTAEDRAAYKKSVAMQSQAVKTQKEETNVAKTTTVQKVPYVSRLTKKVALVIGNASYAKSPLKNPLNDAEDISRKLKSLGFEVITARDCKTKREMRNALEEFCRKAADADAGVFYYSGHGMQLTKEGGNYLIPTEAEMTSEADVTDNCIGLEYVLNKMNDCGIQMKVAIIDACRDNPFRTWNRGGSRGLATVTNAPYGTFIAFATSANDVAADGNDRNSPFTKAFLTALDGDNLEINDVFTEVKSIVKKRTNGGQRPWITNDLSEPFYFGEGK